MPHYLISRVPWHMFFQYLGLLNFSQTFVAVRKTWLLAIYTIVIYHFSWSNAPINVIQLYPSDGLRWGFSFLKVTIPQQLGTYWRYKPPHTPTNLPVAKPGVSGDRRRFTGSSIHEFFFRLSVQVGFTLSYSNQETLRLALALGTLAFVYRFLLMLQIPTTSGNFSDQFPH